MPTSGYKLHRVRASAVLTGSYVAGNIIGIDIGDNDHVEENNELILLLDFTKGSLDSAELKFEFAPEILKSLAYDGQTANFAVGEVVTGVISKAQATIVLDNDGGATGTLTLRNVLGIFQDDEALSGSVTGVAVVNGTLSDATVWYQESVQEVGSGVSVITLLTQQLSASGKYRIPVEIMDRYIRVSAKGTGTTTNSLLTVLATTGSIAT